MGRPISANCHRYFLTSAFRYYCTAFDFNLAALKYPQNWCMEQCGWTVGLILTSLVRTNENIQLVRTLITPTFGQMGSRADNCGHVSCASEMLSRAIYVSQSCVCV